MKVGGRYGKIGVEIVTDSGSQVLAVVNRCQENRRAFLCSANGAINDAHEMQRRKKEIEGLDVGLPEAISLATLMAAAPELRTALRKLMDAIDDSFDEIPSSMFIAYGEAVKALGLATRKNHQ
jgi:hypothetical protein